MKSRNSFTLVFAGAVLLGHGSAYAGLVTDSPALPPPGVYLTPDQVHAEYHGPGLVIVLSQVQHQPFAHGVPGVVPEPTHTPVNDGHDDLETFSSQVSGQVSINGGPNIPANGTGPVSVLVHGYGDSQVGTFDTEMLSLDLTGLPFGAMIRESPTLASLGQTKITDIGGGLYKIDSFFDVFTELSIDGGQTWMPSAAAHVVLFPEPSTVVMLGLGMCGLVGYDARRRRRAVRD